MPEAGITFLGHHVIVACDGVCTKAWGYNQRPSLNLSDNPDDIAWMSDEELGDAPVEPGTYEGNDTKPSDASEFPNKWCVRECERCVMVDNFEEPELPDYSKRRYNIPSSDPEKS